MRAASTNSAPIATDVNIVRESDYKKNKIKV